MKKIILLLLISLLLSLPVLQAQQEIVGTTSGLLNVRANPSADGAVLGILDVQEAVVVEGRTQIGDWLLVHERDGSLRGWVASVYIYLPEGVPVQSLPVVGQPSNLADRPADAPASPEELVDLNNDGTPDISADDLADLEYVAREQVYAIPDLAQNGSLGEMEAVLEGLPTFHNFVTDQARRIVATGRANGNRANVFTRVGDSISARQPFLNGFSNPNDYSLGEYGYLQDTINFFNAPPREGYANSFAYESMAAQSAFSAGGVIDYIWSNPNLCMETEAPLLCEYRLVQPALSVIMLGSVDMQVYDLQAYTNFMNRIVDITIQYDVLPVLTTFPIPSNYLYYEQSLRFNMVVVEIANRLGLPLINLWKEARPLPNHGTGSDNFHLSQGEAFYVFDGAQEKEFGVTLRNLLTLRALHELRLNLPLP